MQKRKRNSRVYSPEFKINVVRDMRENNLSLRATVRKYWQTHSRAEEDLYKKNVRYWERIFLEKGAEELMKETRGRKPKKNSVTADESAELDCRSVKKLIAENQYLRIEIDYIKKLSALVLAEEREKDKKH